MTLSYPSGDVCRVGRVVADTRVHACVLSVFMLDFLSTHGLIVARHLHVTCTSQYCTWYAMTYFASTFVAPHFDEQLRTQVNPDTVPSNCYL